ncbi:YIPF1_2 [Acanthosepion pharaonis]|uniref:Protein YIPF n=1 Tax=Acanthosepion pharaonis TaxID=158019 RepID=A0A812AMR8_ACAPH|nr:YIPF1_2 [Sepia pharaonis]
MADRPAVIVDLDDQEGGKKAAQDELQFQDIDHNVTGRMKDELDLEKGHTHTFSNFPHSAESDDEEGGDKTELLRDEKRPHPFWRFEYYQQFFDVDSNQVFWRIMGSMTPNPRKNFLKTQIRPNPDLYGPFWICTTLVFTTAIAGNLANYFQSKGHSYHWQYDFHKVTFAATAIFSYWWIIPTMLFGLLWWRGSSAGYSFLEMISVYGYSLAIYIPISILWVVQINWFQWLLVIIGASLSGGVLLFTFWPAVREDEKKIAWAAMFLILLFHALLAIGFVLYFFHVPAPIPNHTGTTTTLSPANVPAHSNHPAPSEFSSPALVNKAPIPTSTIKSTKAVQNKTTPSTRKRNVA